MVTSYSLDLWEMYGLTPITIWDLESAHFFSMIPVMEAERKRRKEERDKENRIRR